MLVSEISKQQFIANWFQFEICHDLPDAFLK